jgi:hypothetical protein
MIDGEGFDRHVVEENIKQVKDLYNDVGYALTNYHLRVFKEMIKGLEDAAKRKIENSDAGKKKGFAFKSKFQFKSVESRPRDTESGFDLTEKQLPVADQLTNISETKEKQACKIIIDDKDIRNQYRLSELVDCDIEIKIPLKTLYLHTLKNCRIICGLIDGAIFGDRLENCEISVVAHQIRIHNTLNTIFKVFVSSSMIIEDSNGIQVSELKLSDLNEKDADEFRGSKFFKMQNNWNGVKDFNWIKDTPSPNIKYI